MLAELLRLPENQECMECRARNPTWASTNLGVFLCIRCSGLHRQIGVHITKVKSCTMDLWEPEQIAFIQKMGNAKAKQIWEATLPRDYGKPSETEDSQLVLQWIRTKYEKRKYERQGGAPLHMAASHRTTTAVTSRAAAVGSVVAPPTLPVSQPSSMSALSPVFQTDEPFDERGTEGSGGGGGFNFIGTGAPASAFGFIATGADDAAPGQDAAVTGFAPATTTASQHHYFREYMSPVNQAPSPPQFNVDGTTIAPQPNITNAPAFSFLGAPVAAAPSVRATTDPTQGGAVGFSFPVAMENTGGSHVLPAFGSGGANGLVAALPAPTKAAIPFDPFDDAFPAATVAATQAQPDRSLLPSPMPQSAMPVTQPFVPSTLSPHASPTAVGGGPPAPTSTAVVPPDQAALLQMLAMMQQQQEQLQRMLAAKASGTMAA